MNQENPFLAAADIAQRWSISVASVRRMIWRGDLAYVKIGRSVRVPLSEVQTYEQVHMAT